MVNALHQPRHKVSSYWTKYQTTLMHGMSWDKDFFLFLPFFSPTTEGMSAILMHGQISSLTMGLQFGRNPSSKCGELLNFFNLNAIVNKLSSEIRPLNLHDFRIYCSLTPSELNATWIASIESRLTFQMIFFLSADETISGPFWLQIHGRHFSFL